MNMEKQTDKEQFIESKDLPAGEKVYLKKGFDGWRIVYPLKNEDGTLNWKNLIYGGSIWNLIKILFIIALLIAIIFAYHLDTATCRETLLHINDTCEKIRYIENQIPSIATTPLDRMPILSPIINATK